LIELRINDRLFHQRRTYPLGILVIIKAVASNRGRILLYYNTVTVNFNNFAFYSTSCHNDETKFSFNWRLKSILLSVRIGQR